MPLIFGAITVHQYDANGVCYTRAPSRKKHYIKSAAHIPECFPAHIRRVMEGWVYPPEIEEGECVPDKPTQARSTPTVPSATPFYRGEKVVMLAAALPDTVDRERIASMGIMDIRRHTNSMYTYIRHSTRASAQQHAALTKRIGGLLDENTRLVAERADSYSDSRRSMFKAMADTCACPVCDSDAHLAVTFPCTHTAMCVPCWNQWAAQADTLEKVVCPNCRTPVEALWCKGQWRIRPEPG